MGLYVNALLTSCFSPPRGGATAVQLRQRGRFAAFDRSGQTAQPEPSDQLLHKHRRLRHAVPLAQQHQAGPPQRLPDGGIKRSDVASAGWCMISRGSFRSGNPVVIGMHPFERGVQPGPLRGRHPG
jgi:hypothetical protein